MIEWRSSKSEISINAVLLNYVRTSSGDELIFRTLVHPDEEVMKKSKGKRFKIS